MISFSPSYSVVFSDLASGEVILDATADVISIQTQKNYGRGVGGWKVVLTAKRTLNNKQYHDWLRPNDMVEIKMSAGGRGDKLVCVMLGLIDRVAFVRGVAGDGMPSRQVVISGSDLGKLLSSEIGWDLAPTQMFVGTDNFTNWTARYALMAGTPSRLVKDTFAIAAKDVMPIATYIDTDWVEDTDDWHTLNESGYLIEQTSVWQAMKRVANEPWNVLYADFEDDGAYLHIGLERTPIDEDGYVLRGPEKTIRVPEILILNADLGVGDGERVNLLSLQTPVNSFVASGNALDITLTHQETTKVSVDSITQNGFLPQIFITEFFPKELAAKDSNTGSNVYAAVEKRTKEMWNWFSKNHLYVAGSYTIHGQPRVRAGWKLVDESEDMSYLIESVSHTFNVVPVAQFTTQIQVTHGVPSARTR